jgi:hypothetical protein
MEEKYIVWHIEGGLGKNVAATALLSSLQETYSDRKIVVVASYPEVFLNHPAAYRVYKMGLINNSPTPNNEDSSNEAPKA